MDPNADEFRPHDNYNKVWIIEVKCGAKTRYGTGFAVKGKFIFTCHYVFFGLKDPVIRTRRLDMDNKWYPAEKIYVNRNCDVALLKPNIDYEDYLYAEIAPYQEGALECGAMVTIIDNYHYLLGSAAVGYVAHPCNDYESIKRNSLLGGPVTTCENYNYFPNSKVRCFGSYWNKFVDKTVKELTVYEKKLDALIPVVEIANLPHCGRGDPPSIMYGGGAPVFNRKGKVVGMVRSVVGDNKCVVAIHSAVLRKVLDIQQQQQQQQQKTSVIPPSVDEK